MWWPLLIVFFFSVQLNRADGCQNTKPDFSVPGRRISEQKCHEYNWERKQIENCSNDVANTEYPYMGFLGYRQEQNITFLCGAFLISPKFVVTAAHCVRVPLARALWTPEVVRLGNSKLDENEPHVDIKVRNSTPHFLYNAGKQYDIGLVELESEVPFTKSIHPGCLWSKETLAGVENTFSPGWPKAETDNKKDNALSELKIHVIKPEPCFERVKDHFSLLDSHICANESIANNPHYHGTPAGGSVMVTQFNLDSKAEDRMPFALGLASFEVPFDIDVDIKTGIYTSIYSSLDWIEQTVWK